jgi:hypothetical protein
MSDAEQRSEFWPWQPRRGRPAVPLGMFVVLIVLVFGLSLLLFWLLSGAPGSSPQYG